MYGDLISVSEIKTKILTAINENRFINEVLELEDRRKNTESVVSELIELHKGLIINIPELFLSLDDTTGQYNLFLALDFFSKLLPKLDIEVSEAIEVVDYLHELNQQDLASGTILDAYIDFCVASEDRVIDSLNYSIKHSETKSHFIPLSLIAGSRVNFPKYFSQIIELTTNKSAVVKTSAVFALGRIDYEERQEETEHALKQVSEIVIKEQVSDLYANALKTMISLKRANPQLAIEEEIDNILSVTDDAVLHVASSTFAHQQDVITQSISSKLLIYLLSTDTRNKGTLSNIDYGLSRQIKAENIDSVLEFIEPYLITNQKHITINSFSCTIRMLLDNDNKHLSYIITKWLSSKQTFLCRAVMDILENVYAEEFSIYADIKLLGNDTDKRIFTARKAVGWLFLKPITAASYLISLIDTASDEEAQHIEELLFEPLLLSYSGKVKRYLIKQKEIGNEKTAQIVSRVFSRLLSYDEGLKSAWEIKELRCPQSQYEAWHRHFNQQVSESYKETKKGSITELFTSVTLLYGNCSIHQVHLGDGDSKRVESPLQSFEHSTEFPRLDSLDPYGCDFDLRVLRVEGCDK
ncbi:hypothetical protein [Pseudoalteromonas sp. T1lg21]|uniref:hypothetical protein n=1 Tax=Pseudoalteromonas sp. T1lg21 TaxID=2077095 RepID=UPI000CF6130C|nr:hypothetical protein [Pseudoalteromonas sp. T1lg21]